ncbi:MAG: type II toxin-antitoxin system VapC family toxin [Candidatus Micrarchaeales archaeon]
MAERNVYLDTSAIVKRYMVETGTETVDIIFKDALNKKLKMCFSFWNVGEAIGIFDKYDRRAAKKSILIRKFLNELKTLKDTGSFDSVDISPWAVAEAMTYLLRYHLYIADALQIVSCKSANCTEFITADRRLADAAKAEGIQSTLLTTH